MSDIHTIKLHDRRILVLFEKLEWSETEEELSVYLDTVYAPIKEDMFNDICHFGRYGLLTVGLSELTEEQIIENDIVEIDCMSNFWGSATGYTDYMRLHKYLFTDAKDSLLSLLKANNIDTTKEWVLILKK